MAIYFDMSEKQIAELKAACDRAKEYSAKNDCARHVNARINITISNLLTVDFVGDDWYDTNSTVRTFVSGKEKD